MEEKIQGDYLYVLVHKFDEFCGVYKKLLFILLSMVMNIVQGTYSNNVILMLKSTIDKRYSFLHKPLNTVKGQDSDVLACSLRLELLQSIALSSHRICKCHELL